MNFEISSHNRRISAETLKLTPRGLKPKACFTRQSLKMSSFEDLVYQPSHFLSMQEKFCVLPFTELRGGFGGTPTDH